MNIEDGSHTDLNLGQISMTQIPAKRVLQTETEAKHDKFDKAKPTTAICSRSGKFMKNFIITHRLSVVIVTYVLANHKKHTNSDVRTAKHTKKPSVAQDDSNNS
ncbi:hypothetical protein E2C01_078179 [Portunus trituberculatus]|uniref:Uncharacterized protein n=1 Tax=Portunus trituberculatus TaxID=210409 RepID=A0A5B7IS11_PORTR|nr:hypothetical protein [Portunus trituberculatus]